MFPTNEPRLQQKKKFWISVVFSVSVHLLAIIFLNRHLQYFYDPLTALLKYQNNKTQLTNEQIASYKQKTILSLAFEKDAAQEKETFLETLSDPSIDLSFYDNTYRASVSLETKEQHSASHQWPKEHQPQAQALLGIEQKKPSPLKSQKTNSSNILKQLEMASQNVKAENLSSEHLARQTDPTKNPNQQPISFPQDFLSKTTLHTTHMHPLYRYNEEKKQGFIAKVLQKIEQNDTSIKGGIKYLFPPLLSRLPSLDDLSTVSRGADFDVDIVVMPREDEQGYLFALTLIPNPHRPFKKMPINYAFVLDRSNYIQQQRLTTTRHALSSCLSFMDAQDRFNILAFDRRLEPLVDNPAEANREYISLAKKFLIHQNLSSFFSKTEIALPFSWLLSKSFRKDEINVAVFITSADQWHKRKQFQLLEEWTKQNQGNVSLYTVALQQDKNLAMLDFYSARNKGKLYCALGEKNLKKQLQKLLSQINYPIAKDMTAKAIQYDPKANIELYPKDHRLPNLYLGQPYVILGTAKKLEKFVLFIQGKNADEWFNIKKEISFDHPRKGGGSLLREWAILRSYDCYEKFLFNGNAEHLHEAKEMLDQFNLTSAFQ